MQAASTRAKEAQRAYRRNPSQENWEERSRAYKNRQRTAAQARQKRWRLDIARATSEPKTLWNISKWARLRSSLKPAEAAIPPLGRSEETPASAHTHEEKANLLAERFFPTPPADLSDITDTTFADATSKQRFEVNQSVDLAEITQIISSTGAWKAPGRDNLPTGFLKMCGQPLAKAIAKIANASLACEYFPKRFRCANVVVLRKPGKSAKAQRTPGAYRPIALLSAIGKVIETAISRRIAKAAEEHSLLPNGQMGNRPARSTELAIRVVTEAVHTAWQHGAVASLLQLDIKGAFDTVNHTRMLDTLREKGYPMWVVRWTRSYLEGRTVRLRFDEAEAEPRELRAGVPQGSPLSPILFILYIASLYEALAADDLTTIGFADDTNIISCGTDAKENGKRLEQAWETCTKWARTRGMTFAPEKSELMHFTRARAPITQPIRLDNATIEPTESARFLGVWLDRKLRWARHLKQLNTKMERQKYALTKLAASAWGVSLVRARELYTKVVRSAIAYGASAWHTPSTNNEPKGLAKSLLTTQSQCLRTVAGAYRATPIHCLETEIAVPPLDLYLNKRLVDFEQRLEATGKGELIRGACAAIANHLRNARPRKRRTRAALATIESGTAKAQWAKEWLREGNAKAALHRDWLNRWERRANALQARRQRNYREPAEAVPDLSIDPLEKHRGLLKHESSTLIQMRTGKIGLNSFLFRRRVPDIESPLCSCEQAAETVQHLVTSCILRSTEQEELRAELASPMRTSRDLDIALQDPGTAGKVAKWMLRIGRLHEFRLAREIGGETGELTQHKRKERAKKAKAAKTAKKKQSKRPGTGAGDQAITAWIRIPQDPPNKHRTSGAAQTTRPSTRGAPPNGTGPTATCNKGGLAG